MRRGPGGVGAWVLAVRGITTPLLQIISLTDHRAMLKTPWDGVNTVEWIVRQQEMGHSLSRDRPNHRRFF
jgi:hypothetical protein